MDLLVGTYGAWRIEYEGACFHLLSRGNEGRDIFSEDKDRVVFLDTVGKMSERFEMDVHAYVLMVNHYHLLVCTRQANLKKDMHWFGLSYSAVSHAVRKLKAQLPAIPELQTKFERLNSQFKL